MLLVPAACLTMTVQVNNNACPVLTSRFQQDQQIWAEKACMGTSFFCVFFQWQYSFEKGHLFPCEHSLKN